MDRAEMEGNMSKWNSATVVTLSLAATLVCILAAGCGRSGPKTIPVSGRVTFHDAPVPSGMVMFLPVSDIECRPGRAFIQSDGTYEATTIKKGDGLMAGEYRVSIVPAPFAGNEAQKKGSPSKQGSEGVSSSAYPNFPSRYRDPATSGLTLTVDETAGQVTFDMPLADK